jgi:hypothetical protein
MFSIFPFPLLLFYILSLLFLNPFYPYYVLGVKKTPPSTCSSVALGIVCMCVHTCIHTHTLLWFLTFEKFAMNHILFIQHILTIVLAFIVIYFFTETFWRPTIFLSWLRNSWDTPLKAFIDRNSSLYPFVPWKSTSSKRIHETRNYTFSSRDCHCFWH